MNVPNPLPFPGHNYCGPGNAGGDPTGARDAACQKHDQCYHDGGFNAGSALAGSLNPQQQATADMCNALLCQELKGSKLSGIVDAYIRPLIIGYFAVTTKDVAYSSYCSDDTINALGGPD